MNNKNNQYNCATLEAISVMEFKGNIIPSIWFSKITLENGRPDLLAILILADIIYWYRLLGDRDKKNDKFLGYKMKFTGGMLQRDYTDVGVRYRISLSQTPKTIYRSEKGQGFLIKEVSNKNSCHGMLNNPLFQTFFHLQFQITQRTIT